MNKTERIIEREANTQKRLNYFTGVKVKFHGPTDTKSPRVRASFLDPNDTVMSTRKSRTIDWNDQIKDCYLHVAQLLMNDDARERQALRPFGPAGAWVADCRVSTEDGYIIGFKFEYAKD